MVGTGSDGSGPEVEIRGTINYFGVDHDMAADLPGMTHYGGPHDAPVVRIGSIRERTSFMPLSFTVKVWEEDDWPDADDPLFEDSINWLTAPKEWRNGDVWSRSGGPDELLWSLKDTVQVVQLA